MFPTQIKGMASVVVLGVSYSYPSIYIYIVKYETPGYGELGHGITGTWDYWDMGLLGRGILGYMDIGTLEHGMDTLTLGKWNAILPVGIRWLVLASVAVMCHSIYRVKISLNSSTLFFSLCGMFIIRGYTCAVFLSSP